jgi:hypothetical protein
MALCIMILISLECQFRVDHSSYISLEMKRFVIIINSWIFKIGTQNRLKLLES